MRPERFEVVVIGGGHAGVEAAWAAANVLGGERTVALVTLDPGTIGVMSCNPAIGGLAKGQLVREIDAMGGLMGLAADATGIQFKVLNASKGAAVRGPRAQCDKHAYAEVVRAMIASRPEIQVRAGAVEALRVEHGRIRAAVVRSADGQESVLEAAGVVLTTGTFMRGLMHTGERQTRGGRFGEGSAEGISGALRALGFELGRLKTGTPPRLARGSIDWDALEPQVGDDPPVPFSDLSGSGAAGPAPSLARFPVLPQVDCRMTRTSRAVHDLIRANLHRAPMYSGQITSPGPRYCPSIEDKVVRFASRDEHHVYLEPESLRDDWVYCNGISTSLPADIQETLVRMLPGCGRAVVLRPGYAVEYDTVRPYQIGAGGMTKLVEGLFLAGQVNGTSGYEEAAAQGLVAGLNGARWARGQEPVALERDRAYIGVLMDDLVTRTPTEPYRMFTSRAEHRLRLRADNAPDRLTPLAMELGLLAEGTLARARRERFARRSEQLDALRAVTGARRAGGRSIADDLRRPGSTPADLARLAGAPPGGGDWLPGVIETAHADAVYVPYLERESVEVRRLRELEHRRIPASFDALTAPSLRTEARHALARFRPETLGQAGRLEGITPADLTLLRVLIERAGPGRGAPRPAGAPSA